MTEPTTPFERDDCAVAHISFEDGLVKRGADARLTGDMSSDM